MYEYCDELGTHFVRTFDLRYRNNAPTSSLSFDLADDADSGIGSVPEDTATTEYFPPCETIKERERNKERKRSSQTLVQTSVLNVSPLSRSHTMVHAPETANQNLFRRARSLNPSALGQLKEQAPAHWRLRWNTRSLRCWY